MKKFLTVILALSCAVVCAFALAACGGSHSSHDYATEYSYDDEYHWRPCTGCDDKLDYARHVRTEGSQFCNVCHYDFGSDFDPDKDPDKDPDTDPDKDPDTDPDPDTGDEAFENVTLSTEGILQWNKIKGASKYVISVTFAGETQAQKFDVDQKQVSQDLNNLRVEGFPAGKTTVELTAYAIETVEIGGETHTQEVPMTGVSESFRVTKLNGAYSMTRLKYADEFIILNGFYKTVADGSSESVYVFEQVLQNNRAMKFKTGQYIKGAQNCKLVYYKSAAGRENADAADVWDSANLSMGYPQIDHGENMYYVRAIDAEGNYRDYDLNVYGLYTVSIERLDATPGTDSDGFRTYSTQTLSVNTFTEWDILPADALYEGIASGKLGRDSAYNVIEREDYVIDVADFSPAADGSVTLQIYFYDGNTVRSDSEEYAACAIHFGIGDSEWGMILRSNGSQASGEVTVPYVVAGRKVIRAEFFSSEVTTVYVAEGSTEFVATFAYCRQITDIWLPSTIRTMNEFAFGSSSLDTLPTNMTVHCAFDASVAAGFPNNWNQIAGKTQRFKTVYNDAMPIRQNGLIYKLENGGLTVTGVMQDFDGLIPESARVYGKEYRVLALESIEYAGALKIGKNINRIDLNAFSQAVEVIEVDSANNYFIAENGVLFDCDRTIVYVAQRNLKVAYFGLDVIRIGRNAFTNCDGAELRFACAQMREEWSECDFTNVVTVFDFQELLSENGFDFVLTNAGTAKLIKYTGAETQITVPAQVRGVAVTEIVSGAFAGCANLERAVVPDSVIQMGTNLFEGCAALRELTLPFLGKNLQNPTSMAELIGENVAAALTDLALTRAETLANSAFEGCAALANISLPDTLRTVSASAFEDCATLNYREEGNALYLGNGENSFVLLVRVKSTEIDSIEIAQNCVLVCDGAFDGCNQIVRAKMPVSALEIYAADTARPGTLRVLELTNGDRIDSATIGRYWGLESVSLPVGIREIEQDALSGNGNLKEVIIAAENEYYVSEGGLILDRDRTQIVSVIARATSIVVPDSIESLRGGIFAKCTSVSTMQLPFVGGGENNTEKGSRYFGFVFTKQAIEGSTYNNKNVPETLRKVVITGGEEIASQAFAYINGIMTLEVPNTVKRIGEQAFNCKNLTSLTVPFVRTVDENGTESNVLWKFFHFIKIDGKMQYNVPQSFGRLHLIGAGTLSASSFDHCENISELTLSEETEILDNIFDKLPRLQYNKYENAQYFGSESNPYQFFVRILDQSALSYNIHPDTKVIVERAFYQSAITAIEIPESVRQIGSWAFANSKLQRIEIPGSVKDIHPMAFWSCKQLVDVYLSEGVETIGYQAFEECSALKNISIPDSIQDVGVGAFSYCTSLKENIYENGSYCGNENNPYVVLYQVTTTQEGIYTIHANTKAIGARIIYSKPPKQFNFEGTVEEWNAIAKSPDWNLYEYGRYTVRVVCTDGEITAG